ncbi:MULTISPECIES: S1C family serine protease [Phocaeicola]|uniref:Trypsin-like peptidase domain-containing protein n=1 Tax=Phocaeicola intestinalis TaxID=2762212 RepID=A0ABR8YBT5_9BACT|nr:MULTISPECIES: serine protease [Phocaeicola]MBD8041673.1 trypsin-like peptidase domain-containing protein [Phocaeicola intestinalis]MDM8305821.1 serine protease [Phocaeicola salanitronis]
MRKKFYYYTIIIVSMLVTTTKLYAQISPRNVEELMSYFANNTQNLDPIEGVYDVNIEQWGENAFRKFPSETTNITMVIYKDRTGIFRVFKNEQVTIKKIGSTPIYNYNIFWSGSNITDSKRFVLHENTLFDVNYSIPDRQLRYDLGKNYQAGFKVNYKCSFIKTYPTPEMYANSQKQDKSQESFNQWSGTGFALKDGYIVTNYHVIEGANSITIQGVNGNFNIQYNTSIVGTDKINDLALLKVTDPTFKGFGIIPYSISSAISEVGEEIFVLGYPLTSTMGDEIKLTTGVISSKTGFQGDIALYQISAPIQPGNSGGPLFDKNGNVIGIVSAKHKDAENVGYAVKTLYLQNLIESSLSSAIIPMTNSISEKTLPDKVKKLKTFVYMIKCSK